MTHDEARLFRAKLRDSKGQHVQCADARCKVARKPRRVPCMFAGLIRNVEDAGCALCDRSRKVNTPVPPADRPAQDWK